MSKKKNKVRVGNFLPGFQQSVELLKNECSSALSEGRIRRAFLCLKELLSHKDFSADCLPLAGKIIEQKMLQMHLEGDDSQIAGMFQAVLAKAPALRGHIQPEYRVLPHWQESNASYWQNYENDATIKDQVDAFVLKLLRDPREIANHKLIAETHPLKQTAKLIVSVWAELEQGNATRLEELNRDISRHSPFVTWRLFLNALQAYYTGQETPALENLARIRPDSPLFKVAAELSGLIKNRGKAESKLQETILGETRENSLLKKVVQLEESLGKSLSSYQRNELVRSVFSDELHQNRPLLYWNLGALFLTMLFAQEKNEDPWLEILQNVKDYLRMLLLHNHLGNIEDLEEWIDFTKTEGLSNLEQALVNDWIATLYSLKLHPEKDDFFFDRSEIRPARALNFYNRMQYYWEKSTQLYPLQEAFDKWHRMSEFFLPPAQSDKILEDWLAAFPDAVSAFCKLLNSARKRKVYTKAVTQLKRLEEVAPNHPGQTLVRELLQIETALSLIEKNRNQEAIRLSDEFTQPSCLFVSAFQNFVRVLLEKHEVTIEFPLIARHLRGTMQRNKFNCQKDIFLPQYQETNAEKFFQEFEALLAQGDVIWGDVWLSDLEFPEKGLSGLSRISSERIWSLCRFFMDQAPRYYYGVNLLNFLWTLSAEGLSRQDNLTGAFLFLRGYLLVTLYYYTPPSVAEKATRERAIAVFATASKHLRKVGNLDPLKNLQHYLYQLKVSINAFTEFSENLGLKRSQKIIDAELAAAIKPLLKKIHLANCSFRKNEKKEYPRLLEGYTLLDEEFDDDDDFDDDDFDDFDKAVPAELKALFKKLSKTLH